MVPILIGLEAHVSPLGFSRNFFPQCAWGYYGEINLFSTAAAISTARVQKGISGEKCWPSFVLLGKLRQKCSKRAAGGGG